MNGLVKVALVAVAFVVLSGALAFSAVQALGLLCGLLAVAGAVALYDEPPVEPGSCETECDRTHSESGAEAATTGKRMFTFGLAILLVFATSQGFLLVPNPVAGAVILFLFAWLGGIVWRSRRRTARRLAEVPLVLDYGMPLPPRRRLKYVPRRRRGS